MNWRIIEEIAICGNCGKSISSSRQSWPIEESISDIKSFPPATRDKMKSLYDSENYLFNS